MKKAGPGDSKAVLQEDRVALDRLEGFLSKRSSYGTWQKRYFCVNNQFLNYFSSKRMATLRATADLSELEEDPSLVNNFGEISLSFPDGEVSLRARNLKEAMTWVKGLAARREYFVNGPGANWDRAGRPSLASLGPEDGDEDGDEDDAEDDAEDDGLGTETETKDSPSASLDSPKSAGSGEAGIAVKFKRIATRKANGVRARDKEWASHAKGKCVKSGWLMKKSPSRFKAWQSRYVRLMGGSLYYYKNERADLGNFLGRISVGGDVVKRRTDEEGGAVFIIEACMRTYVLKAETPALVTEWLAAIEAHNTARAASAAEQAAGVQSSTEEESGGEEALAEPDPVPLWMIEWDAAETVERMEKIQAHLDARFNGTTDDLEKTLAAATGLIEELDEVQSECLEDGRERVDVLAGHIKLYHLRVEHEIGYFVVGERLEALSIHDMLRLMDLITAYEEFLAKLLAGEHGDALCDELPPFTLGASLETMAVRYLCELQDSLGTWAENIIRNNLARGAQCIEKKRQDSTVLCTSAPVDILNMVNETLVMARASGVEQIEAAVVKCCLIAVADYVSNLLHSLKVTKKGRALATDLLYLCAATNDCSTMIDYLDDVERREGEKHKGLVTEWEPVRAQYDQFAAKMIRMIVDMIHSDLTQLYEALFTPQHLDVSRGDLANNVMAQVTATLDDYLADIRAALLRPYYDKLLRILVGDVVVRYVGRLLSRSAVRLDGARFADEMVSSDKGSYSALATFASFEPTEPLRMDDVHHVESDRAMLVAAVHDFAGSEDLRMFSNELGVFEGVSDLLRISPQFFASAVLKMCGAQPRALQRSVIATALSCLSLRPDVSRAEVSEIRHGISKSLWGASIAKRGFGTTEGGSAHTLGKAQVFQRLWPDLVISKGLQEKVKGLANLARSRAASSASSPKPQGKPQGQDEAGKQKAQAQTETTTAPQDQEQPRQTASMHAGVGGDRRKTLIHAVSWDISEEAVRKRKEERMTKLDVNEDIRDVNQHGYMDKRSPDAPFPWQRRWFLVHEAMDDSTKQWKMALSWHVSHKAPVKSRLFLEHIRKIELVTPMPVVLSADGITLVLDKKRVSSFVSADRKYMFKVITKERVFSFRTASMSETLTWVNGLNKASREAKRVASDLRASERKGAAAATAPDGSRMPAKRKSEGFESLSMAQLRSLCASKGYKVDTSTPREKLMEMLTRKQDRMELAERANVEERAKLLLSKSIRELREACETHGLDASECVDKSDLVNLVACSTDAGSKEEQEAHFRYLIVRGLTLLEDHETGAGEEPSAAAEEAVEEAIGIFERVARDASTQGFALIEARAMHGLASAYLNVECRKNAAPLMFEMASNMFFDAGELADAKTCIMEASELYRTTGAYEDAIRALVEFDTKSKSLAFSSHIEQLRNEVHRRDNPAPAGRFKGLFTRRSA